MPSTIPHGKFNECVIMKDSCDFLLKWVCVYVCVFSHGFFLLFLKTICLICKSLHVS